MRDTHGERRLISRFFMWAGFSIVLGIVLLFAGAEAWLIMNWAAIGWPGALALQGVWFLAFGWVSSQIARLAYAGLGGR